MLDMVGATTMTVRLLRFTYNSSSYGFESTNSEVCLKCLFFSSTNEGKLRYQELACIWEGDPDSERAHPTNDDCRPNQ